MAEFTTLGSGSLSASLTVGARGKIQSIEMYEDRRVDLKWASQGALFAYTRNNFWKCQITLADEMTQEPWFKGCVQEDTAFHMFPLLPEFWDLTKLIF